MCSRWGGALEDKNRPKIFDFMGWLDVFYALLTICLLIIRAHGYTQVILFWLFVFYSSFYFLLKTLFFPDLFISKITNKGKLTYCFIGLSAF